MTKDHERVAEEIAHDFAEWLPVHASSTIEERAYLANMIAAALAAEGARAHEAGWRLGREETLEGILANNTHKSIMLGDVRYTPPEEQP